MPQGFSLNAAAARVVDIYSNGRDLQYGLAQIAGIFVIGIVAWRLVGLPALPVAVVGFVGVLLVAVVRPLQALIVLKRRNGRIPEGSRYAAIYGEHGFKVKFPSGGECVFRYPEIANIRSHGSFVFFTFSPDGTRVVLPSDLLPEKNPSWLCRRVASETHSPEK